MRRIVQVSVIALLVGSFSMSSAWAQDCTEDVETMAAQGAELFRSEQFLEAADVLLNAYGCEPVPVLLYNIARAYQQADRCVLASRYFRQYLSTGDTQAVSQAQEHEPGETTCAANFDALITDAENAISQSNLNDAEQLIRQAREVSDEPEARLLYAEVLFHLSRCDEAVAFLNNSSNSGDLDDDQQAQWATELTRAEECRGAVECEQDRLACEEEKRLREVEANASGESQRLIGLVVTGVGGAVLLGAIIHDATSQSVIDDYETAAAAGNQEDYNDLADDISSAKTLSWVLYSIGAAGVVAGLVVYFTAGGGYVDDTDCTAVCWDWGVGTPGADAGVWLGGTF